MATKIRPHATDAEFNYSLVSELTQLDTKINARPREPQTSLAPSSTPTQTHQHRS